MVSIVYAYGCVARVRTCGRGKLVVSVGMHRLELRLRYRLCVQDCNSDDM